MRIMLAAVTYSVVLRDGSGTSVEASVSHYPHVGMIVPRASYRSAGATQAAIGGAAQPTYDDLQYARGGDYRDLSVVCADVAASHPQRLGIQFAMIDDRGQGAYTGPLCVPYADHRYERRGGSAVAVAGNHLANEDVLHDMFMVWLDQYERLGLQELAISMLRAGAAASGDRRGDCSATLCVTTGTGFRRYDVERAVDPVELLDLQTPVRGVHFNGAIPLDPQPRDPQVAAITTSVSAFNAAMKQRKPDDAIRYATAALPLLPADVVPTFRPDHLRWVSHLLWRQNRFAEAEAYAKESAKFGRLWLELSRDIVDLTDRSTKIAGPEELAEADFHRWLVPVLEVELGRPDPQIDGQSTPGLTVDL